MQNLFLIPVVDCFACVHKNERVGGREKEEEAKAVESMIVKTLTPQLVSDWSPASPGTICLYDTETWQFSCSWCRQFSFGLCPCISCQYLRFLYICILSFWKPFQNDALCHSIVRNWISLWDINLLVWQSIVLDASSVCGIVSESLGTISY